MCRPAVSGLGKLGWLGSYFNVPYRTVATREYLTLEEVEGEFIVPYRRLKVVRMGVPATGNNQLLHFPGWLAAPARLGVQDSLFAWLY